MKGFWTLLAVEWKLNNRNFLNVFFSLVFPIMMLLLFGSMYGNTPSEFNGGFGGVDVSVPGYICMVIAVSGLMTLPLTLSVYRERKILKRFMVSPMKPESILLSQLLVNTITTLIGLVLLIVVGKIVFDLHFFGNILETILVFIITLFSIFSLGLCIAGISKNVKMTTAIAYIIYFPMLFLSGATMPLQMLPKGVMTISKILPLTYGVKAMKGVWLGESITNYGLEIGILGVLCIIFTGVSVIIFKWE